MAALATAEALGEEISRTAEYTEKQQRLEIEINEAQEKLRQLNTSIQAAGKRVAVRLRVAKRLQKESIEKRASEGIVVDSDLEDSMEVEMYEQRLAGAKQLLHEIESENQLLSLKLSPFETKGFFRLVRLRFELCILLGNVGFAIFGEIVASGGELS